MPGLFLDGEGVASGAEHGGDAGVLEAVEFVFLGEPECRTDVVAPVVAVPFLVGPFLAGAEPFAEDVPVVRAVEVSEVYHEVDDLGRHRDDGGFPVLADGVRDEDGLFVYIDVGELEHGNLLGPDEHVVQEVADEQERTVVGLQPVVQTGDVAFGDDRALFLQLGFGE